MVSNEDRGKGIVASSINSTGVHGSSIEGSGVYGYSELKGGNGVYGEAYSAQNLNDQQLRASGVYGTSDYAGVRGYSVGGYYAFSVGVEGTSLGDGTGVSGDGGLIGVLGRSFEEQGIGVSGESFGVDSSAVYGVGYGEDNVGVYGEGNVGVLGKSPNVAVHGVSSGLAGYFEGWVFQTGGILVADQVIANVMIAPVKSFRIDHPLDPQNKYLQHASIEAPEMKNLYDGVVVLDEEGAAWVSLPEWFGELNQDFRYQLTAIEAPAPQLHVAQEISEENRAFKIAGGEPGMKVSWQLTGIRKDKWAEANPLAVEPEKPAEERGRYLHPELYGEPEERGIHRPPVIRPRKRARERERERERAEELLRSRRPPQPPQPSPAPPLSPTSPDYSPHLEEHQRQIRELRGQIEALRRQMKRHMERREETPPEE